MALEEANIDLDVPVTLKVEGISLKSALNLLLRQAKLTFVIRDEVVCITTPEYLKGNLKVVTYPVADLVVPNPNHPAVVADFYKAMKRHIDPVPFLGPYSLKQGEVVSSNGSVSQACNGIDGGKQIVPRDLNRTLEDLLIRLIQLTIEPNSWDENGGKGTLQYFPLGLALVVNHTEDVQEQVADLLAALRRLQMREIKQYVIQVRVMEAQRRGKPSVIASPQLMTTLGQERPGGDRPEPSDRGWGCSRYFLPVMAPGVRKCRGWAELQRHHRRPVWR